MVGMRFGVLGALEVMSGGERMRLGGLRQERLLAVMLLEADRVVPVSRLIDALWDGQPPATAKTQVHKTVLGLRHVLGADVLVSDPAGYRLRLGAAELDSRVFAEHVERADRAAEQGRLAKAAAAARAGLELWRGLALAGMTGSVVRAGAQRLDEQRLAMRERCLDWELELGQHARIVAELTELVAEHPLRERFRGQLVLALYRAGRQADALAVYEDGRRRLVEELGIDPGRELREIHQRVLTETDPGPTQPTPIADSASTTPATEAPVPRQLPAPPPLFVGRLAELAALSKAVDTQAVPGGTVVISAIGGAGGIGKTFLALHWAHQNVDRFPDGQLHVNLRGFDPSGAPMSPDTAVRGFLHALGVPAAAVPSDLDTQVGLYRSLVAGKRMLVLLDNAHDTAQVEPLLPGSATCTVLITSRNHLAGLRVRGAHLVDLDVLTTDEAQQLIASRLPTGLAAAEPDAVTDLLSQCGGLPLAISIVAARATTHPDFPLTVLADELRDTSTRLDALDAGDLTTNLRTVLSWSYRALPPPVASMFRLLGLAPGPDISLPGAASLAALPLAQARKLLRALESAHLLTEHAPGRYRMHDLTGLYASERADHDTPEPDRQQALRRLVDFYLHTAHSGDRNLVPHRPPIQLDTPTPGCDPHPLADPAAALAWFDAEHVCLLAAQHAAAAQNWHRAVWQLAWSLTTYHYRLGHSHDDLAVWRAGLAATEHLANLSIQSLAHRLLGRACALVSRHSEAFHHLHQALTLAEQAQDRTTQAHVHHSLASAWEQRGDDRRALEHATRALLLFQTLDNPVEEARALNDVGWFAAHIGDHDQARAHCEAALNLHRRHHNRDGEAHTLDSLGYIAQRTGQHIHAIAYYQQALALVRNLNLGNVFLEADILDRAGHPHAALGQHEQARAVWQQALDLYRTQHRTTDADRVRQQLTASLARFPPGQDINEAKPDPEASSGQQVLGR